MAEVNEVSIPILLLDREEFFDDLFKLKTVVKRRDFSSVVGMYFYNMNLQGYPKEFVWLANGSDLKLLITTLYHELGHYKCRREVCYCIFFPMNIIAEIHAYKYQLKKCLEKDLVELVESSVEMIVLTATYGEKKDLHTIAAMIIIMDEPVFVKALKYLVKHGIIKVVDEKVEDVNSLESD